MISLKKRFKLLKSIAYNNYYFTKTAAEITNIDIKNAVSEVLNVHNPPEGLSQLNVMSVITPEVLSEIVIKVIPLTEPVGKNIDLILKSYNINFKSIADSICQLIQNRYGKSPRLITPDAINSIVDEKIKEKFTLSDSLAAANLKKLTGRSTAEQSSLNPSELDFLTQSNARYNLLLKISQQELDDLDAPSSSKSEDIASSKEIVISALYKIISYSIKQILIFAKVFTESYSTPSSTSSSSSPSSFFSNIFTGTDPYEYNPPQATQTKYPLNSSYQDYVFLHGIISTTNPSRDSLANELVKWTNEVYQGVPEEYIRSSTKFKNLVTKISDRNILTGNTERTFFPPEYRSKKSVVDYFIDDVAETHPGPAKSEAPKSSSPTPEDLAKPNDDDSLKDLPD